MPNILKVTKEEISWQLSGSSINAGAQANARIIEYLGEDAKYFAPMSATTTGYTWTSPETGWVSLSSASPIQRDLIEAQLAALRSRIQQKLATKPKLANEILSLPSDDGKYIFFNEYGGNIRILIAGWGFSNARRKVIIPGKNKKEINTIPTAKIGFTINGELQPSHKFYITTIGGASKECYTDVSGFYHLGEQKVGTKVNLIDADSEKAISFSVEGDKSDYVFDITRMTKLYIKITCDDEALGDACVSIHYRGASHTYTTNSLGEVNLTLPYFNNEVVNVEVDGNEKSAICQFPETSIEIQLTNPQKEKEKEIVPEPPADNIKQVIIKCTNQFGEIRSDYPITTVISGKVSEGLTNKEGIIELPSQKVGVNLKVIDGFDNNNTLTHIVSEADNVIEFVIPESEAVIPDNVLKMIGVDGNPISNKKVVLRQGDKTLILSLDNDGSTRFKSNEFECDKEMSAQILSKENDHDVIPFTLDLDEHNYVIQEEIATKKPWWHKFLNIVAAILLIIAVAELGAIFVQHLPIV